MSKKLIVMTQNWVIQVQVVWLAYKRKILKYFGTKYDAWKIGIILKFLVNIADF